MLANGVENVDCTRHLAYAVSFHKIKSLWWGRMVRFGLMACYAEEELGGVHPTYSIIPITYRKSID